MSTGTVLTMAHLNALEAELQDTIKAAVLPAPDADFVEVVEMMFGLDGRRRDGLGPAVRCDAAASVSIGRYGGQHYVLAVHQGDAVTDVHMTESDARELRRMIDRALAEA